MTTSIRDLLAAACREMTNTQPTAETAAAAAAAIQHCGRIAARLADVLDRESPTQQAITALSTACAATAATWPSADARVAALVGVAADVAARDWHGWDHQARWAAGLAFADTARTAAAAAAAFGPYRNVPQLHAVYDAAAMVRRAADADPPAPSGWAVLDRLVPNARPDIAVDPARAAADAAAALVAAVHAASARNTLCVAETIGCTAAAELAARHSATLTAILCGRANVPAAATAAADGWRVVRQALGPFDDGTKRAPPHSLDVLTWATELHRTLHQHLGPASPEAVEAMRKRNDLPQLATALRVVANQLPDLARHLDRSVTRWAIEGRLLAPERLLPRYEKRNLVALPGARRVVVATASDVAPVRTALRDAKLLSVSLAAELDRSTGRIGRQPQPYVAAAHAATIPGAAASLRRSAARASLRCGAEATPTWGFAPTHGTAR